MTRYIGKQPAFGNFVKLDPISVVNGQASYTMQNSSSNFTNYDNVNQFIVSLNGIIQAPTDSFTVSGSTITFASALSTGDVINFILVLGDVLSVGTPSDNTVSTAKLQDNAVQTAKIQDDAVTRDKINAISTSSLPSFEAKGTSGQTDGYIQLNCEFNTHGIKLKSPPHSAGQSYTLTFPDTAPATDKMLQTNSSGVLSFVDAPSGAMKLLHTATGSNVTQIDMTGYFTSEYDHYKYIYTTYPATNNTDSIVRIMQGGSVITSSNYWYAGMGMYRAAGTTTANSDGSNGANHWRISSSDQTSNAQYPTSGELLLNNPLSTTHNTTFTTTNIGYNSGGTPTAIRVWTFAGQYVDASASSGLSFQYDGGNIYGTIRLYGIVNS